jgi:hypothetical protein
MPVISKPCCYDFIYIYIYMSMTQAIQSSGRCVFVSEIYALDVTRLMVNGEGESHGIR